MPFDAAPSSAKADCQLCPVQNCLARCGDSVEDAAWSQILAPRAAVMPGTAPLFRSGDRQRQLYTVRGGCLKTYTVDAEGNERIRGFYFPGDPIGLDALEGGVYLSTAAAVTPSQVCVAPIYELKRLMTSQSWLSQRIIAKTSRELALALTTSGDFSVEQRVVAFLLNMHERVGGGEVLRLSMPQRDIGNYLRMANETVCRTLKGLERKGWIVFEQHSVRFVDEARLAEVAEAVGIVSAEQRRAA